MYLQHVYTGVYYKYRKINIIGKEIICSLDFQNVRLPQQQHVI